MTKAVLLIGFNRPQKTAKVIEALQVAKPRSLYFACDGPRAGVETDIVRCRQVRELVSQIDWDCDISTRFSENNSGCKLGVSAAITWFFEHVESGIILEDDCVPHPSFFQFCDEILARYRDDPHVGCVTGDNFQAGQKHGPASYYFSKYPHIWGWGSWKRAWDLYDVTASDKSDRDETVINNFYSCKTEAVYWQDRFSQIRSGQHDTWDYQWVRTLWKHKMMTVTPQVNLVKNIGFDSDATHTHSPYAGLPDAESIPFPLIHPRNLQVCQTADAKIYNQFFRESRMAALKRRLKRIGNSVVNGVRGTQSADG